MDEIGIQRAKRLPEFPYERWAPVEVRHPPLLRRRQSQRDHPERSLLVIRVRFAAVDEADLMPEGKLLGRLPRDDAGTGIRISPAQDRDLHACSCPSNGVPIGRGNPVAAYRLKNALHCRQFSLTS